MEKKTTVVFHGFLNLATREKMELVNAINEYFDSNAREPIRAANDSDFLKLRSGEKPIECPCCGN